MKTAIRPIISNKRVFKDFERFIKFYSKNKENIEDMRVKPPKLGVSGFGSIEIKLKSVYGAKEKWR